MHDVECANQLSEARKDGDAENFVASWGELQCVRSKS